MKTILNPDQKRLLRKTCNYLASLGMSDGLIEFEVDTEDFCDDYTSINWEHVTHFDNNYTAEVPDFLIPIFQQIVKYVCENNMVTIPDIDDINYRRISIDIDCEKKEISLEHYYSYYEASETESVEYSLEEDGEDESLVEALQSIRDDDEITDSELELQYNGSGDSGFIEDTFTNGDSVPSPVEDFCYSKLESNFGGWEINEGSQGRFEIDMERGSITLYHTMNVDQSESDTIYEEKF